MKKFFLNPLCAGVMVGIAVLAGCMNLLEPQKEAGPQGRGSVVVTIGETAAGGSARTIAPAESEFAKITLTFSGEETIAPLEVTGGVSTSPVSLLVGSWTITATGCIEPEPGVFIAVAEGTADVEVLSGDTAAVNILLGPITGGGIGTFSYSLMVPYTIDGGQLIITTAKGDPVETITLSYSYMGITGSRDLDPGQYLARIRLEREAGDTVMYAGLTEALHIYSGLTSALPHKVFAADDFKTAVSELDLTSLITAPVYWQTPVIAFAGTDQYTGTVAWRESGGPTSVADIFRAGTVYEAVVTLMARTDYTFTGVVGNSFAYTGAATVANNADSGVVTITFPPTDVQSITGVTVSPPSPSVAQGGTQKFSAVVTGSVAPPQTVTWTITGNSDAGTTIAADGTLTVALNESASTLTVTAASIADPFQDDTATVAITAAAVIDIPSAADLAKIGADPAYPLGGRYRLTASFALSDWVPIGDSAAPFFGVIDGNGKTITLQSFDAAVVSGKTYLGIFGYVKGGSATSKALIDDLYIVSSVNNTTATIGQTIGLVAGCAENAEISDVDIQGSLTYRTQQTIYAGGVVGIAQGGSVIRDCTGNLDLTADGGTGGALVPGLAVFNYVGGFVGIFKDGVDILNCHNTGDVTSYCTVASSQVYAGGITGGSNYGFGIAYNGKIEDCSYAGVLHAKAMGFWTYAGGIAGTIVGGGNGNPTRIVRSFVTGTVSVEDTSSPWPYIGGVVGYNYYGALVSQSYFTGNVIANRGTDYTGGIAGYNSQTSAPNNSTIEDCWSSGTVTGFNNAGGIVGQNQMNTYIRRCYSTATVIATNTGATGVGGIAGMNASAVTNSITGSVALNPLIETQTGASSNIHRIAGGGSSTQNINNLAWSGMTVHAAGTYTPDIGANGKDGADIAVQPSQAAYEALGWDFTNVWAMDSYGYPKLQWQTTDTPRPPLAGPVPVVSVVNYNHYDTSLSAYTDNAGGKLTVSWLPVPGATSYDIYYAPRTTDVPDIPLIAAATGETGTSKVFIDAAIGNNTMNYYVWIKANNSVGASAATHTSTLDRFMGTWTAANQMDAFMITNADTINLALWAGWFDENYAGEYDLLSYIRAVVPFADGSETVNFNGKIGQAGIIVVEYDRSVDSNLMWSHLANNYFNALYYYGVTGDGAQRRACLGFTADQIHAYGDPDYGCDVADVNAAVTKFTLADKDDFFDPSATPVVYNWEP